MVHRASSPFTNFPPKSNIVAVFVESLGYQLTQHPVSLPQLQPLPDLDQSTPDNSTLFALWRTYSSLDQTIDDSGRTKLPPPQRLIFPHNRFFTDANPPFGDHWIRRRRADTGFHPYLAKAAFPHLTVQYFEDWEDYQQMEVPFVYERVVLADRGIAAKEVKEGEPPYSPTSLLDLSDNWWEPVRKSVAQFLDGYEYNPKAKKVLTYLHSQSEQEPKLSSEAHRALVKALEKLAYKYGYELHIASTETAETDWVERMGAVVKSSVRISNY